MSTNRKDSGDHEKDPYLEPDRSLKTWKKWTKVHQIESKTLAECTNRPPIDVAMHLPEGVRKIREEKMVLEHAHVLTRPHEKGSSKYDKKFRFRQYCPTDPEYEVKKTPIEKGRPRPVEHIGVPKYILENEMGLVGTPQRNTFKRINCDYVLYKRKREADLSEIIDRLDPYRPQIDELIIKGNRPRIPPKPPAPLPNITIDFAKLIPQPETETVFALRINNTILIKEIKHQNLDYLHKYRNRPWTETCTSWTYYFNVSAQKIGRSKLFLKNLGTATIRYCWKKLKRPIPLIPDNAPEQVFFFNKCEDVLSPGQERSILFTFSSSKIGIFSEFWEFSPLNVNFLESPGDKLIVNFHADAKRDMDLVLSKIERLTREINLKAVYNIVNAIIYDVITTSTCVRPEVYPYKKYLLEAQMFTLKNPLCYYHQSEVEKVRGYFEEMVPKTEWDLSISAVREALIKKVYEEREKYYELLKQSHWRFLKHWDEAEPLYLRKSRAVYLLLGQFLDKFDIEYEKMNAKSVHEREDKTKRKSTMSHGTNTFNKLIIYFNINKYLRDTIDKCAGVLSSIDLERWIKFDFCKN